MKAYLGREKDKDILGTVYVPDILLIVRPGRSDWKNPNFNMVQRYQTLEPGISNCPPNADLKNVLKIAQVEVLGNTWGKFTLYLLMKMKFG